MKKPSRFDFNKERKGPLFGVAVFYRSNAGEDFFVFAPNKQALNRILKEKQVVHISADIFPATLFNEILVKK